LQVQKIRSSFSDWNTTDRVSSDNANCKSEDTAGCTLDSTDHTPSDTACLSSDTAKYTLSDIAERMLLNPADSMSLYIAKFVISDNAHGVASDTVKCI
jgi:hypothetical protein